MAEMQPNINPATIDQKPESNLIDFMGELAKKREAKQEQAKLLKAELKHHYVDLLTNLAHDYHLRGEFMAELKPEDRKARHSQMKLATLLLAATESCHELKDDGISEKLAKFYTNEHFRTRFQQLYSNVRFLPISVNEKHAIRQMLADIKDLLVCLNNQIHETYQDQLDNEVCEYCYDHFDAENEDRWEEEQ